MKKAALALGCLAMTEMVGCGGVTRLGSPPAAVQAPGSALRSTIVADTHQGGSGTLRVALSARSAAFAAQAIVHRPVAADVVEDDISLAAYGSVILTVPVMVKQGQTTAVFEHLKLHTPYLVNVVAKGNDGGDPTVPLAILNSQTPATGSVLFAGNNDVNDEQSITVSVQLDNVIFDGQTTVAIAETDGSYATPGVPEGGSAIGGSPTPTLAPTSVPTLAPTPVPTLAPTPAPPVPPPTPQPSPNPVPSPSPSQLGAWGLWVMPESQAGTVQFYWKYRDNPALLPPSGSLQIFCVEGPDRGFSSPMLPLPPGGVFDFGPVPISQPGLDTFGLEIGPPFSLTGPFVATASLTP